MVLKSRIEARLVPDANLPNAHSLTPAESYQGGLSRSNVAAMAVYEQGHTWRPSHRRHPLSCRSLCCSFAPSFQVAVWSLPTPPPLIRTHNTRCDVAGTSATPVSTTS